jgi:hypothetical protein
MNHLLVPRHVVFDESYFPFASSGPPPGDLDSLFSSNPAVHTITPPYLSSIVGTSETVAMPRVAPAPPPAPHLASVSTRGPDAPARTTRGPGVHSCTTRGSDAPARATHGTSVLICVFVCAMCGLSFMLHPAPHCVPAMTFDPRTGANPRRVVGLPPRRRGS